MGVANGSGAVTGVAGGSASDAGTAAGRSAIVADGATSTGTASTGTASTGTASTGTASPGGTTAPGGIAAPGLVDVAAVDNHPIVLDGIASWVTAPDGGIRVVGTAATVDSLLAGPGRRAHVVLLDVDLRDGTSVERNVAAILAAGPAVLVLAASDKPPAVRAAIRAGALGYVLKDEETAQVRAAIRSVAVGQDWVSPRLAYIFATDDATDRPVLSPQETRALQLYATGMPMKSVARRMALSEETAKQYVGRVREKYARAGRAAPTKLELYHRAVEDGHLPPHP
jgi:DNA-binding NarL/FixJ family response regulator